MSKKTSLNSSDPEYRERRITIKIRWERGRRTYQLCLDDHLTFELSVSSALFVIFLFLIFAAGCHWLAH